MKTKRLLVRLVKATFLLGVLLVAVLWSGFFYASPVAANYNEPVGDRIRINFGGSITFPANEPFHIVHGWGVTSDDEAIGVYDFQLEVDGVPIKEDFKDFRAESGDPDILLRRWLFNFPEGMTGEHTFTGHWFAPCQAAVNQYGYAGPCPTPNQKVETYSAELFVEFTTTPPDMYLRVNYGHDWVESFYQTGHGILITVTDPDQNVKATANLVTEQKEYWGGEPGFQTMDTTWFDDQGNSMESPPDIQPFDHVYAEVDNGVNAQVQIGEINGFIDFEDDSIQGGIIAPWYSDELFVECFPWGAPEPQPEMKYDAVYSEDTEGYSCSWTGEWEIGTEQDIGVGYFGPDGHWVANAFYSNAWFVASESGDWFWTNAFAPGSSLDYFIYESNDPGAALLGSGSSAPTDEGGFAFIGYEDHFVDMVPGNYLVIEDGDVRKGLVLEAISVDVFDPVNDIMIGTAPFDREVWAAAGLQDYQERLPVFADIPSIDPDAGSWFANFGAIGWDITEEMRPWSYVSLYDVDGDVNEGSTQPLASLIVANQPDWIDTGITLSAGQSFSIEASGLMNPCSDTYPNGADFCIFYPPFGGDWDVPEFNEYGVFPGKGLRFMALLGKVGDGQPFIIGEGGAFVAGQAGTLWLTPNDNLRTDNQGAYYVWVWLE